MTTQRGFTLIELAIVLVIMTILIGGLAVPLSAQIQARRIAETRTEMNATRDALLGFAMSHVCSINCALSTNYPLTTSCQNARSDYCGSAAASDQPLITRHYLPCQDMDGDGREDRNANSGECINAAATVRGGLPWLTLGVKGHDAWGNRFTYAVTPAFAAHSGVTTTPTGTPPTVMPGELNVFADRTCVSAYVAENVPLIIVSHGANGRGATNVNGGTPLAAASVPVEERQNLAIAPANLICPSTPVHDFTDSSFVHRNPSETFDDILLWMSSGEVFNRVCPASGCP
jgi:prepilin-type N-terminal cleavage/methylation domain-containing protein